MSLLQTIVGIEERAKAASLSVDQFCERAQIDRATWQRWKAGKTKPSFDAWQRVSDCAASLPPTPSRGEEAA